MVNRNGPWTKSTKLIIDKSNLGSGQGGEGEEEKEEGRGGEERGGAAIHMHNPSFIIQYLFIV